MTASDEELAARLVILSLGKVGPARSRWLLSATSGVDAVEALRCRALPVSADDPPVGVSQTLVERWFADVGRVDGAELLDRHRQAGQELLVPEDPRWPFAEDPEPPVVLFATGDVDALRHGPKVGLVGTRRCTSVGRRVADGFGLEVTEGGASVVSGLALGIDGAAHLGALSASGGPKPIAVVATGLDHIYPASNAPIWEALVSDGLLLSEAPLGTAPERWRFPARNRLIAGLIDVLVVVESHSRGGALLTVDEAATRDVPVVAVPGSVASAASAGTNDLLVEGCQPVRSAADVLGLLDLSTATAAPVQQQLHLASEADRLMAEVGAGAVHIDTLVAAIGQPVAEVLALVRDLQIAGRVTLGGGWVELRVEQQ